MNIIDRLNRKLHAFNEGGVNEAMFKDIQSWVSENFGEKAAGFMTLMLRMEDRRFKFKDGNKEEVDIARLLRCIVALLVDNIFTREHDHGEVMFRTGIRINKEPR